MKSKKLLHQQIPAISQFQVWLQDHAYDILSTKGILGQDVRFERDFDDAIHDEKVIPS